MNQTNGCFTFPHVLQRKDTKTWLDHPPLDSEKDPKGEERDLMFSGSGEGAILDDARKAGIRA